MSIIGGRGRGFSYSDVAIETALMIKGIFSLLISELLDVAMIRFPYSPSGRQHGLRARSLSQFIIYVDECSTNIT